jgi:hypothetical protein
MFNYDLHPVEFFSGAILTCLFAVWIWKWQEGNEPKKVENTDPPLAVPDVIVTFSKYLDGTIKIHATNAYSVAIVETGKNHVIDTVLKEAGYQHIQQYKIEPPQATLEASTELVPVAVEVPRTEQDVALDDVYTPDEEPIKKKEEKPLSKWQEFISKIK